MMKCLLSSLTAASLMSIATPQLGAQGYPNQAINLVIPLAPGDAADVTARTAGEGLAKLRVPVVPINRPGAGATIGTDSVVKARKDGYTILMTPNAAVVSSRILNPETVPYDSLKDLTPLGLATRTPILIAVRHDAPYKSFGEMVEFVKKNPGKVRVGTIGSGSAGHFAVEIINSLTGAGADHGAVQRRGPGDHCASRGSCGGGGVHAGRGERPSEEWSDEGNRHVE
jgi:tripartite-type tricarboxylate transporter receptor subunit TctC